jgi:hypothetical protein
MREWSASELDRYNKKGTTRKQDNGSKEPIKKEINVPRTASTPTQAAMRLNDSKSKKGSGLQLELSLDRNCTSSTTSTRAGGAKRML